MTDVATSELRANLSTWIRRVREGEEVVITDRGFPVARIIAVDQESIVERLTREGVLGLPTSTEPFRAADQPRVKARGGPISDMVIQMREDDGEWP